MSEIPVCTDTELRDMFKLAYDARAHSEHRLAIEGYHMQPDRLEYVYLVLNVLNSLDKSLHLIQAYRRYIVNNAK